MTTGLEVPTLNQLSLLPFSGGGQSYSAASIGKSSQYCTSSDFAVSSRKITIKTPGVYLVSYIGYYYASSSGTSNSQRRYVSVSSATSIGGLFNHGGVASNNTIRDMFQGYMYFAFNSGHTITLSMSEDADGNTEAYGTITAIKIA